VATLGRLLRSNDDPEVRSAAWRALRETDTPEARRAMAPYPPAVRVDDVLPGSQAKRLSLSPNDVITRYDGKPVRDSHILRDLVLSTPPEEIVPLEVDRGGWTTTHFVHGGLLGVRVQDGAVLD
jgi:S1-C subfamily serine protease